MASSAPQSLVFKDKTRSIRHVISVSSILLNESKKGFLKVGVWGMFALLIRMVQEKGIN